jgi:hypothetical protein
MARKRKIPRMRPSFRLAHNVETAFEDERLEQTLSKLFGLIKRSNEYVKSLSQRDLDPDHAKELADEEEDFVNAILGCAFVLCQTQVTVVASRVVTAAKSLDIKVKERWQAIELGTRTVKQIARDVDLAANYFKHNDEWISTREEDADGERRYHWVLDGLKPVAKFTIEAAIDAELKPNDRENMRTLARLLGVKKRDYSDLPSVVKRISRWRKQMARIVRSAKA